VNNFGVATACRPANFETYEKYGEIVFAHGKLIELINIVKNLAGHIAAQIFIRLVIYL
jgi:hypothetical protein